MVKKKSEKTKFYEKERRDRLNQTIEELAKLLPTYDPSVPWSKVEVLRKSIEYVKETKERRMKCIEAYGDQDVLGELSIVIVCV